MTQVLQCINDLTWQEFEDFCAKLIEAMGFSNITQRKSGSQTGRDIDAKLDVDDGRSERWYFECKHYPAAGAVPFKEIVDKLYLLHRLSPAPDALVIICSGRFSNDLSDFLENYAEDLDYPVITITQDPPTSPFENLVYSYQDAPGVKAFLERKGCAIPPLQGPKPKNYLEILRREKEKLGGARIRVERALRLNAYPRLAAEFRWKTWSSPTLTMILTIKNIGSGFAEDCKLFMYDPNDHSVVEERELGTIVINEKQKLRLVHRFQGDSKNLLWERIAILTYRNALDNTFQVTFSLRFKREGSANPVTSCQRL